MVYMGKFCGSSGCISGSQGSVFWSIVLLFQLVSGVLLSKEVFNSQMRKALQLAGEDSTQYHVTASEIGLQQQWPQWELRIRQSGHWVGGSAQHTSCI